MKKYVCPVCGYVHEGDMPEGFKCPLCGVPGEKFKLMEDNAALAAEHVFGVGTQLDGVDTKTGQDLQCLLQRLLTVEIRKNTQFHNIKPFLSISFVRKRCITRYFMTPETMTKVPSPGFSRTVTARTAPHASSPSVPQTPYRRQSSKCNVTSVSDVQSVLTT